MKVYCVVFFLLTCVFVNVSNAQVVIRADFMAGMANPIGQEFEQKARFGVGYSLDVTYAPNILDNQLSFGIAKDGNALFSANASVNGKKAEVKVSLLSLSGLKTRFDLKTTSCVSPYAALTIGVGGLKCGFARVKYNGTDENCVDSDVVVDYEKAYAFTVKPEIGVSIGWFQMSLGWILPRKYGVHKVSAGAFMYNLGFRLKFD